MMKTFSLSSNSLKSQMGNDHLFDDFGLNGKNLSPHLKWENIPEGTKSFVVICHDADAPSPSGWWHWCAFNIPSTCTELNIGATNLPESAIETRNDFNRKGYGGACPPPGHGDHAYTFTVYATSLEKIDLDETTMPSLVMFMLFENTLGKATLVSYFGR